MSFHLGDASVPGGEQVIQQWETAGIEAQQTAMPEGAILKALTGGQYQAALMIWTNPDERGKWVTQFGAANVIDLYSLPISYLAVPGFQITFTPDGWPLPTR